MDQSNLVVAQRRASPAIHRAAFLKRGLYCCPIVLRHDEYRTDRPITISHLRTGVSAGLVSDFGCSIRGKLVEDCDHQMGQLYPKVAARTDEGRRTFCDSVECEHSEGQILLVRAHTFVARPRYPLAGIVEEAKDMAPLHGDRRVQYAAGHGNLNCDLDLGPCKGFNEIKTGTSTMCLGLATMRTGDPMCQEPVCLAGCCRSAGVTALPEDVDMAR